jgi:hypothetical protein
MVPVAAYLLDVGDPGLGSRSALASDKTDHAYTRGHLWLGQPP